MFMSRGLLQFAIIFTWAIHETAIRTVNNQYDYHDDDSSNEDIFIAQQHTLSEDTIIAQLIGVNVHVEIQVPDSQAHNPSLIRQRQMAIDNHSYRSTIEAWIPTSLQQLAETIKAFAKGKPLVDRHWIIFYWITHNIAYDTISYFAKDYKDQSPEGVFRTKRGVCAGYANLYKYLCDQLQMPCEVVGGYSKGYGFDDREGAPSETDHAWNAVEIDHRWYLMESTWGAGHLNKHQTFERKLNSYYFLPRPNEMIYHHLPENDKWQLLYAPINMTQYMQMPKVHPTYFELNLELVSPRNQAHVDLLPDKPYALVLIRAPSHVHVTADMELNDEKIDGGHRVTFDHQKKLYCCYFAPSKTGKHKITIYGKQDASQNDTYSAVIELTLDTKQMPLNPISFPKIWENFFDLRLEIISPQNTHLIKLDNGINHTEILIKTPHHVQLFVRLKNEQGQEVVGGERIYYDQQKNMWRCLFAPDGDGFFEALIMAKKTSDPGHYSSTVSFKIEAKKIPTPSLSYPKTWENFFDLSLEIISPQNTHLIKLDNGTNHTEIRIKTPDHVQLLGQLRNEQGQEIVGGERIYHDRRKNIWRCMIAPDRDGLFEAFIMAKKTSDPEDYTSAVSFKIEAKRIPTPPLSYPKTWENFFDLGLEIISPQNTHLIQLDNGINHTEIQIKTPDHVQLLGQLKNEQGQEVAGGDRVYYDRRKNIWRHLFAPDRDGLFEALIIAKNTYDPGEYTSTISFKIEAKRIPTPPLSYAKTWENFFDLGLEIISPQNTHLIKLDNGINHTEIQIKTPDHVQLLGQLKNEQGQEIVGGERIYHDRGKNIWRCMIAPDRDGLFEALIMAKKTSDPGDYTSAVSFKIEAKRIPTPPLSYPKTWENFFDLGLEIISPQNTHLIKLDNGINHTEILIKTPDHVQLLGQLKNEQGQGVAGGERVYHDRRQNIWRCLFAPDRDGLFEALIFAKKTSDPGHYSSTVSFKIEAKRIPSPPLSNPKTWENFFDLSLEIISPQNTHLIQLDNGINHTEIQIKTPDHVQLLGQLKNEQGQEIVGGERVYYDRRQNNWRCLFAPDRDGLFEALIFAKKTSDPGEYSSIISFKIEAKRIPKPPLSYAKTWQLFHDFDMKIEPPQDQRTIILSTDHSEVEIYIKIPNDVDLLGRLTNDDDENIEDGYQVFFDQNTGFWRCKFAPNRNGMFKALIMAKKKSNSGHYTAAVSFNIETKQIRSSPLSYPHTWPLFYDLGLQIEAPTNRSSVVWPDNASYAEVLIQAPTDIQLSCHIQYNNVIVENGSLAQFDHEKKLWQLLFAPEQIGLHELIVFAKRMNDSDSLLEPVVKFNLAVTELRRPMKFPLIYTQFQIKKCRIYTSMDGILKKGAVVPIHCVIPGATDVNLKVDSKWLKSEGYTDPVLQRQITAGAKEVVIYAKYGDTSDYDGLVRYTVQ